MRRGGEKPKPRTLHIAFQLQDTEVDRFLKYKAATFLRVNAEAGRKLMLERLTQVEAETALAEGSRSNARV